ncbi:hypothetical protein BPC006_I0732 [Burkholderia pseudomallei BPC006]|nr:hypothetical protein BPC006_I0732 [Burkholderia pseudomallei BPC006]
MPARNGCAWFVAGETISKGISKEAFDIARLLELRV